MKNILAIIMFTLILPTAQAEIQVVYGKDNRQDMYQVTNALHKKLAASTAGMVRVGMLTRSSKANMFDLQGSQSLERADNMCTSEAFAQQPTAPVCSGFLVGPDTLVTAGHCYNAMGTPEDTCKQFVWVFDYDMKSAAANPTRDISFGNVYMCKKVVSVKRDGNVDFSIIKLDRSVVGREPLKFRTSGTISNSVQLVVIGHPSGLPTKVSAGARVTFNSEPTRFSTTLDSFHGNSGSAVFDAASGQIEGILIMGKSDYTPSIPSNPKSCLVTNKCDENAQNCTAGVEAGVVAKGEVVLRITAAMADIKLGLSTK